MDETKFWKIISAGGKQVLDDEDEQLEAIEEKLSSCAPEELVEFQKLFDARLIEAYTQDLWGAAYLMNGGCSDDGFLYWRSWLISRGKKAFEAALENPDSLAKWADPDRDDFEQEQLMYLAADLYEQAEGKPLPRSKQKHPAKPKGQAWDYDDEDAVRKHLPKMAAIYLESEEDEDE